MDNSSKRPIYLNPDLMELTKSINPNAEYKDATDFKVDGPTTFPNTTSRTYNVQEEHIFRRDFLGNLDVHYATTKLIEALNQHKAGITLTEHQMLALTAVFPGHYSFVDQSIADSLVSVQFKLTEEERFKIIAEYSNRCADDYEHVTTIR